MKFADRKTVEKMRRGYPAGCRIVLDEMDDPYTKIPPGSQAVCRGVDDAGNILCSWDTGSSLSIAFGADRCHKVSTEEEARISLDWYGRHQPDAEARCPRCGGMMPGKTARHALSRWARIMVCDSCGVSEALEQAGIIRKKPLMEWTAIKGPQSGGGEWKSG